MISDYLALPEMVFLREHWAAMLAVFSVVLVVAHLIKRARDRW